MTPGEERHLRAVFKHRFALLPPHLQDHYLVVVRPKLKAMNDVDKLSGDVVVTLLRAMDGCTPPGCYEKT